MPNPVRRPANCLNGGGHGAGRTLSDFNMPELPEVETVCRGLDPLIRGRRVTGIEVRVRRLREPVVRRDMVRLRGATLTGIRRRSKYLLLDTDAGLTLVAPAARTGALLAAGSKTSSSFPLAA